VLLFPFGPIALAMPTTAGQALPATSHDATAPGQALAVPADVAMPSSARAPVGRQLAWQVLFPDSKDVGYWCGYDQQDIVTSLESTSDPNGLLRFEYPWSNGRSVTYEADTVRMVVRKDGADYARRLRRVFVQSPPAAAVLNFGGSIRWQVLYKRRGVEYWWDYDAAVSETLEQCLANEQSLWFCWDWGRLKQGKISNYEADPRNGIVRNLENGRDKPLRRVLVANM
jgi:hypothetical protein